MTPLTSEIYRLPESTRFVEFIQFFNLGYLYYNEKVLLYNNCFICAIYTEYQFPFIYLFNYKKMLKVDIDRILTSKSELFWEIMSNIEKDNHFDYINNLFALKRIYCYFEILQSQYKDIFECEINVKYIEHFDSFDPEYYGINDILNEIGKRKL